MPRVRVSKWQHAQRDDTCGRHNGGRSSIAPARLRPFFTVEPGHVACFASPRFRNMKSSRARSFSSAGKISRSALFAGAGVTALAAVTVVVMARAGTQDERAVAVDAGRHVLSAAQSWKASNSAGCPTITELVESGELDLAARTDDAWGNRFRIVCDGVHAGVRSAGPDGRLDTPDDLRIDRDDG
jgi:hypothetical protein